MRRWVVRDVMTPDVIVVGADAGYKEIVQTMLHHAVSAVPVVDPRGRVIGVVSELDLMHKVEFAGLESHVRLFERKRQQVARAKAAAGIAETLMTSPAVVIPASASLVAAACLMHQAGLKRLPVVDDNGGLVGIVSRGDVLRAYLRTDAEIRNDVTDGVLARSMWLAPYEVSVTVEQGIVTLSGRLDRKSAVEIAVDLVRGVPGVVDVVNHLSYREDDTINKDRRSLLGAAGTNGSPVGR